MTTGIADAIALRPAGTPELVVERKSNIAPTREILEHYREHMRTCLHMTQADTGLIVLLTSGTVIPATRSTLAWTLS